MLLPSNETPTKAQWQSMALENSFGQLIADEGKNTLIMPTHFNFNAKGSYIERYG